MLESHASGWASDAPTPAQMKELFAQVDSGRVTKARMQEFLRNGESAPVQIKGRKGFVEFLEKELSARGFSHWYETDEYGGPHYIGIPMKRNPVLKFFLGRGDIKIAKIEAEPDAPWNEIGSDAFRIRILNPTFLSHLEPIVKAFRTAGFGLPAEIID